MSVAESYLVKSIKTYIKYQVPSRTTNVNRVRFFLLETLMNNALDKVSENITVSKTSTAMYIAVRPAKQ